MKICYINKKFSAAHRELIGIVEGILEEYSAQGYVMTLRQVYYQCVSRDLIPNKQQEYKRLGGILNDARLAGLLDWDHMEDRTRNLAKQPHWDSPEDIVRACADQFKIDRWATQPNYVEVWVEKEALASVIERAAYQMRCPYFCCRGYTSQSELWGAAMRLLDVLRSGRRVAVIHLGDHDPSGIDMTRDIKDRLDLFLSHHNRAREEWDLHRIALNMDQIEEYNPPPNPAKATDARFASYQANFGDESWELDALDPATLNQLIVDRIQEHVTDADAWQAAIEQEDTHKDDLTKVADDWEQISNNL